MAFVYDIFVVLHFIGMAGLVGGLLIGVFEKPLQIKKPAIHSGLLVLLAGILLVIINSVQHANDSSIEMIDHSKIGVKLLVVIAILVLGFKSLAKNEVSKRTYMTMLGLALLNILIAVFW